MSARSRQKPVMPIPPAAPAPEPLPRAAVVLLAALTAAVIVALCSWRIADLDVWQHLAVGRAIWQLKRVPLEQVWVWPVYGQPDVLPSWLFRVLLWPFWAAGQVQGLFAWRWLAALAAFALLWRAAREAGARGPWVFVALTWCAMFYRFRSQVRPETLVAVLAAAQMWVLERRRVRGVPERGLDPAWAVVPIALLWANTHLSYTVGLALTAFHAIDAWWASRRGPSRRPGTLALVLLASVAVSFANPFGWRALAQPFEYALLWRHEAIYQTIGELAPIDWPMYAASGLPFWLAALALLALWRWRRSGPDLVQLLGLLVFVPQALSTQRFLGYLGFLLAPAFARDADALLEQLSARFLRGAWPRTALAAALIVAMPWLSWRDDTVRPWPTVRWDLVPVRASDWIEAHGVRGRAFNDFDLGGWLLWRFWPQPDRLPFMDIHQSGTPLDRNLTALAHAQPGPWAQLDAERRFDWVLLDRPRTEWNHLPDHLDADPAFALVFADDAALLYLRRDGADSLLARRFAFRVLPGGTASIARVGATVAASPVARAALRADLRRALADSRWNGGAHSLLANVDLLEGRWGDAVAQLDSARRADPSLPLLAERARLALDSLEASRR